LSLPELENKEKRESVTFSTVRTFPLIKEALAAGKFVIVEDVRFKDEAALVSRLGGILIRISRNAETVEQPSLPLETKKETVKLVGKKRRRKGTSFSTKKRKKVQGKTQKILVNATHRSETEQDSLHADFLLSNRGTLDDLQKLVNYFVSNNVEDPNFQEITVNDAKIAKVRSGDCSFTSPPSGPSDPSNPSGDFSLPQLETSSLSSAEIASVA
jgi:hypothetical protein